MTGKTCVITGGANGTGRCLVETFAAQGARVAFIDTDKNSGYKLAERLGDTPDSMAIGRAVEVRL